VEEQKKIAAIESAMNRGRKMKKYYLKESFVSHLLNLLKLQAWTPTAVVYSIMVGGIFLETDPTKFIFNTFCMSYDCSRQSSVLGLNN
jgi:hypothetical protein